MNMNKPNWMLMDTWGDFIKLRANVAGIFECAACGSREDMTIDHIEPRIYGGKDDASNLQPMCRSCNSKKGIRHDSYWGQHH